MSSKHVVLVLALALFGALLATPVAAESTRQASPPGTPEGSSQAQNGWDNEDTILAATVVVLLATMGVMTWQSLTLRKSLRSSTYSQIVDQNLKINAMLIANCDSEQLSDLLHGAQTGSVEEAKLSILASSIIDHYENVFVQHKVFNLPETVWGGWEAYMASRITGNRILRDQWLSMRESMDEDFRAYVDASLPRHEPDEESA